MRAALRRFWRAVLRALARDVTAETAQRSCLVLAPHPDDETLGCGVAIMRKVEAGRRVVVVFATDGRHSHRSGAVTPAQLAAIRRDEARAATSLLGLPPDALRFLDFVDGSLAEQPEALHSSLRGVIADFRPEEILAPSLLDPHPDHKALARAARALARDELPTAHLLEYPVALWDAWPWLASSRGLPARAWHFLAEPVRWLCTLRPVSVSASGYRERKRAALAAHASQVRGIAGATGWRTFDEAFLEPLLGERELYFSVRRPGRGR